MTPRDKAMMKWAEEMHRRDIARARERWQTAGDCANVVTMSFAMFRDSAWPDGVIDDSGIYVLRDGETVLYVGMTTGHVADRWFGGRGHMCRDMFGRWFGQDAVGWAIDDAGHDADSWTMEFWTVGSVAEILECSNEIREAERNMIWARRPELNVLCNED